MKSPRPACRLVALLGIGAVVLTAPVLAQDCPGLVNHWPPWRIQSDNIQAVAVSGDYAYVVGSGLSVVDVSTPSAPAEVGFVDTPDIGRAIVVEGGYAYVADGEAGLRVIDVSTPSAPVAVGAHGGMGAAVDVAVEGGYAYVAVADPSYPYHGGLYVIDVSTPSAPVRVGFGDVGGSANGVAVADGYAYVTYGSVGSGEGGMFVVDVSTPSAPVRVRALESHEERAQGIAVSDGYAYVTYYSYYLQQGRLGVIDISTPSAPVEVGLVAMPRAENVAVSGGYAYVAGAGLHVIDVSVPSAPVEVGSDDTLGGAQDVAVAGGYAYVAGGGLRMIDVSVPSAPVEAGFAAMLTAADVAVSGSYAYVAVADPYYGGLYVIDVSTPSAPVDVGFLPRGGSDVAVEGHYAYLIGRGEEVSFGLTVIDVSVPSAPVAVGDILGYGGGGDLDVAISGSYAYVAGDDLHVIDVSTPSAPVEVGHLDTPGAAEAVAVSGGYAYVAGRNDWPSTTETLRVIDVSTPSAPVEVGIVDFAPLSAVMGVAVQGGYAYVVGTNFIVIDVSTPSAPVEVGLLDTPDWALGVAVEGDYAYVADLNAGLRVIDVSTPSAPVEVGYYETPHVEYWRDVGVAVSEGHVFFADATAGLYVFRDCAPGPTPDARECFIPAAAVAAGAQGAFFSTDVEINNTGTEEAEVHFQWLPRGQDNSEPVQSEPIALAPGQGLRYENVLTEVFNLEPDSLGALKMTATTESVIGMSRTYNVPGAKAAGTFGQGLPAIRATEMIQGTEPRRIIFLSEDPDSRANVGCVNGSSQPVTVNIGLFNADGEPLETKTMDLAPYSNNQINRIFEDYAPANGYVDVWADSDEALYYCYGSMLDNLTSDPTTILPQVPSADTTFIPAAALAAGLEGSFFQTDVDLNNVGSTDLTYELLWLPRGADNTEPTRSDAFSLAPGAGVRYANVLDEVFGLDPDQVGALALEASGIDLLAMNRTYNLPSAKVAGTFGQELPGIPADRMIPSGVKKRIIFMNENDDARSNVGCQNGSQQTVRVFIELFNSAGESLETRTMDLAPWSNNQITRVFRDYSPVEAGYVDVWTDTEGASIYCYGSVLDNLTSDPTTVLPQ